ncbi:CBS domain protein [Thermasporomyces composti]|uniref:CBS domain protein n=1 Tax=Thermasporomyces composti TaxID=696763 RepID=A0A3D9VG30_THECX|nr:CBS domain protein [Thermasporomyces composti]
MKVTEEEDDADSAVEGGGAVSAANEPVYQGGLVGTANGHGHQGGPVSAAEVDRDRPVTTVGPARSVVPWQLRGEQVPRSQASTPVARLMSTAAPTVRADAPLASAIELFLVSRCRHMLVLHADGTCAGVVADRDILADWPLDAERLTARQVRHVLSHVTPMVETDCSVVDVARLMARYRVDAVAVVDEVGRPVGLVTSNEIVRLVASMS